MLVEKRQYRDQPFDLRPISWATLDDLDLELFERTYLPASVSPEVRRKMNGTIGKGCRRSDW
jgi:ATP-dependent DNA helicase RecG